MTEQRVRVRLRGYDIELLDQAAKSIVAAVKKSGAKFQALYHCRPNINKITVLRSCSC